MLATLAFAAQLLALAPQYATFGLPQTLPLPLPLPLNLPLNLPLTLTLTLALALALTRYATFGAQAYVDSQGAVRPCSLECATSHSDGPDAPPCAAKCQVRFGSGLGLGSANPNPNPNLNSNPYPNP